MRYFSVEIFFCISDRIYNKTSMFGIITKISIRKKNYDIDGKCLCCMLESRKINPGYITRSAGAELFLERICMISNFMKNFSCYIFHKTQQSITVTLNHARSCLNISYIRIVEYEIRQKKFSIVNCCCCCKFILYI